MFWQKNRSPFYWKKYKGIIKFNLRLNMMVFRKYYLTCFIAIISLSGLTAFGQQKNSYPFEDEIKAYKIKDSLKMPAPGGDLFIGSSSIRLWDGLEQRFPDNPIVKRGVGGCEISQLLNHFTPEILFPYQPAKVFIYAGENDIAAGKSADQVFNDFEKLWALIQEKLPKTKIYYLAIKPSNSRTKFIPEFERANAKIQSFLKSKSKGKYIDVATAVLNAQGVPDSALFKNDQLHLNDKGYDLWEKKVKPYL